MTTQDFTDQLNMYTVDAFPIDRGECVNGNILRLDETSVELRWLNPLELALTRSHDAQGAQARVTVSCDRDGLEAASGFVHAAFAFARS